MTIIMPTKLVIDKNEVAKLIDTHMKLGNKETARKLSMLWVCL